MSEGNYNGLYYRTNTFIEGRPTIVFVHGLTGSSSAWIPYEHALQNKFNILSFDLRGHGKSKKFTKYNDYEIKSFAIDLNDLVIHLSISNFFLVGHSMGTLIIAEYNKLFPNDVAGLVFLSPIFGVEKSFSGYLLRAFLSVTSLIKLFPFHPKLGYHVDYRKYPNTKDWNMRRFFADSRNTTYRIHMYCLRQSMNVGQEYHLEKINKPVLIVHGEFDSMSPLKKVIELSKVIPNSKLEIIRNSDHIIALNNISEIVPMIEGFLDETSR